MSRNGIAAFEFKPALPAAWPARAIDPSASVLALLPVVVPVLTAFSNGRTPAGVISTIAFALLALGAFLFRQFSLPAPAIRAGKLVRLDGNGVTWIYGPDSKLFVPWDHVDGLQIASAAEIFRGFDRKAAASKLRAVRLVALELRNVASLDVETRKAVRECDNVFPVIPADGMSADDLSIALKTYSDSYHALAPVTAGA